MPCEVCSYNVFHHGALWDCRYLRRLPVHANRLLTYVGYFQGGRPRALSALHEQEIESGYQVMTSALRPRWHPLQARNVFKV